MLPSPPRRYKKNRLSVGLVPEDSLDTEFRCPHLRLLFRESEDIQNPVGAKCDGCNEDLGYTEEMESRDTVMREVADWLDLNEWGSHWNDRKREMRRMLPLVDQASTLLATHSSSQHPLCLDPRTPNVDAWIYIIALFLLASCLTILPGSSRHDMPSTRQWRGRSVVTALRLHWLYRYAPAAGHHARVTSETVHEPWRTKYTQRRANTWSDGPPDVSDDPGTPADSLTSEGRVPGGRLARCVCHPMPSRPSSKKARKSPLARLAAVSKASPSPGPRRRAQSPFKAFAPYRSLKSPVPRAVAASRLRPSSPTTRAIPANPPMFARENSPTPRMNPTEVRARPNIPSADPTPGDMDECVGWRA